MAANRTYVVLHDDTAQTAAKTLIQLATPAGKGLELIRCWITQRTNTSSEMLTAQIITNTGVGTGTAYTPRKLAGAGDPAAGVTALVNLTGEGAGTSELHDEAFNVLNGFIWIPTPEERIQIADSSWCGLRLDTAPGASMNIRAGMVFREIG